MKKFKFCWHTPSLDDVKPFSDVTKSCCSNKPSIFLVEKWNQIISSQSFFHHSKLFSWNMCFFFLSLPKLSQNWFKCKTLNLNRGPCYKTLTTKEARGLDNLCYFLPLPYTSEQDYGCTITVGHVGHPVLRLTHPSRNFFVLH